MCKMTELPKNISTIHTPPKYVKREIPKPPPKDEKALAETIRWVQNRIAETYDI